MSRKSRQKLYLIDGANYLFRAFYAIGPLSTSQGLPTNALYGFTQMLVSLVRDEKPDYIAVLFDTKEPTFRDALYPAYKANRKESPEDLVPQFPYVRPIVEALGIAAFERPGFEADDLMGTFARRFASDDLDVVIVSGDKDLMQLVDDHVTLLDTMKQKRIGKNEVWEKFGVDPEHVVDVLGLAGDSSDNIPGIPGIGPKTATTLVSHYGSLENILREAPNITGTLGEKIRTHAESAKLSRTLATIKTDIAVDVSLDRLVSKGPDPVKARELFSELEFTKVLSALVPTESVSRRGYQLIQDEALLRDYVAKAKNARRFSLDLETTSLHPMEAAIVGISLAIAPGDAAYIPVGHHVELGEYQIPLDVVLTELRELLADPTSTCIGQNLKYDLLILKRYGVEAHTKLFDTMIASYLLNSASQHNLDALAELHLGHTTITYEARISFADVSLPQARDYAAEDADVAFRLADIFSKKLCEANLVTIFETLEIPLMAVLMTMEEAGVLIDPEKLSGLSKEFHEKLTTLEQEIFALAGAPFNINSPKQLGDILFGKLQLSGAKKTKTGFSTSQDVLETLAHEHPLPKLVLTYRSFMKLTSTYVDALPNLINKKTHRLHTSFNQTIAATGRLSSSDPNLQNIPIRTAEGRRIREAFVPPPGFLFVDCDYSQIELRVLAHMSREQKLIDAFREGGDVHVMTAAEIFGKGLKRVTKEERSVGKTVNFSTIYGQSAFGLAQQLDIDPKEAAIYIEAYFARYPKVASYRDEVLETARKTGKVETLFGRRRLVPDIMSPNVQVRAATERVAFNTVFQGTAADIIKKAMIALHQQLSSISAQSKMILQVHDELVFEVPEEDAEKVSKAVKKAMESAVILDVPLVADVSTGKTWAEAHTL